jgi:hypothetical protein
MALDAHDNGMQRTASATADAERGQPLFWVLLGIGLWTGVAACGAGGTLDGIRAKVVWESSVEDSLEDVSYVEPALAVSPRSADHVAVAAIRVDASRTWRVSAFRSSDGGQTWSATPLPAIEGATLIADPWLYWSRSGELYLSVLAHRTTPDGVDRGLVYTYRSSDQGESWSEPAMVPYGRPESFDHPVIDGITDKDGDELLVVFATPPSISRSLDGAESFSEPELLFRDLERRTLGAGVLALDGAVVMTWTLEDEPRSALIVARKDTLGPVVATVFDSMSVWRGASILAADRSEMSRFRGHLYAVWTTDTRGDVDIPVIRFASSADGGRSWSSATVLSESSEPRFRAIPYVAVTSSGVVGATWYEGSGSGSCGRLVFRASPNGGRDWGATIPLTNVDRCPENGRELVAGRWPSGSDYGALAASPDGAFLAAWSDARGGVYRVRVARVEVEP